VNNMFSKAAIWVVVALVLFTLFKQFEGKAGTSGMASVPYSEFLDEVKAKHIKEVTIDDSTRTVIAVTTEGKKSSRKVLSLIVGLSVTWLLMALSLIASLLKSNRSYRKCLFPGFRCFC